LQKLWTKLPFAFCELILFFSDGFVGKVGNYLSEMLVPIILRILRRVLGAYVYERVARVYEYVFHQRNPLLQLLYLSLILGGYGVREYVCV